MLLPEIEFEPLTAALEATTVVFAGDGGTLSGLAAKLDKASGGQLRRAGEAARFKGKRKQIYEVLAPHALEQVRIIVAGTAGSEPMTRREWADLGGRIAGRIGEVEAASVVVEAAGGAKAETAELAARLAMGAMLRLYTFDKYRSAPPRKDNGNGEPGEKSAETPKLARLKIHVPDPAAARDAFALLEPLARGTMLARDLVNEPANVLGPVEFAERCADLATLGVEIEVLEPEALEKIGMRALLAVAQGSVRPARVVVMTWNGGKSKRARPLCFVGKGVVFDTGGISMKPAAGMEDMKGDMGGAAAVAGLMHALAGRKAPVNAIGIVGLVENMPSGSAQRPGDIVRSLSGQTVEVLNTDAEGRLVLCDLLWYANERYKPRFMINLATLTGAIMVALGKEHAGLFSNDDKLAGELAAAGTATGELVWRMPLSAAYDKLIDSKNADMKNIGGRFGGAITAAQFLKRFVKDTPWAHLDVAGVAMDSTKTDTSQTWASGWGVQLLDALVADHYEKG
ncbi:MAG: leucyl aminopeptidase [Hyphomicrobiaceae bacterium]